MGMRAGDTAPGYAGQMKTMRQMHDQMMAAKIPEERNALMAEHMKTMHQGMAMMNQMGGMQGGKGMPGNMAERQQMLEQLMDMMQPMMQMTMDRMPAVPATK